MARPKTDSLEYYSRDTKHQTNEEYIEAVHGLIGFAILEKLRMKIYGSEFGYYCPFNEIEQRMFCKKVGISLDTLKSILEDCFLPEIGLFSKEMFDKYKILTSVGIQKRWLRIVKEANRKRCQIDEKYDLTIETTSALELMGEETTPRLALNGDETSQSKVNKSKVKETKENNGSVAQAPPPTPLGGKIDKRNQVVPAPTLAELEKYFLECTAGFWRPELAKQEANKLFNHYAETAKDGGWRQKSGNKIVDWKATANKWILTDNSTDFMIRSGKMERKSVIPPAPQNSDSISKECEYLYQRFLENQLRPESIQLAHYNFLKVQIDEIITDDKRLEIKKAAAKERKKILTGSNEGSIIRLLSLYEADNWDEILKADAVNFNTVCKRLAVIEFFKYKQSLSALNLRVA